MEAEHEMEVKELRQQLKRVHSKDPKQEEYVRKKKTVNCFPIASFLYLLFLNIYIGFSFFIFFPDLWLPYQIFFPYLASSFFSIRNNFITDSSTGR